MESPIHAHLRMGKASLEARWKRLQAWLQHRFNRNATVSIEHILFLVGVQSRGRGYEPELDKELKQDLIMEGTYCVFAELGFYERIGMEADGRWVWERVVPEADDLSVEEQEKLLKVAILAYFEGSLQEE